jgi:chromosome segregation ATPase
MARAGRSPPRSMSLPNSKLPLPPRSATRSTRCLIDPNELENALQLLEAYEAGRAALLPLTQTSEVLKTSEVSQDILGVASELVRAPEELRSAVRLTLGQTLIVRDRGTARRLQA